MAVGTTLQEDAVLVATRYPVSWDIQIVKGITKRADGGFTVTSVCWMLRGSELILDGAYLELFSLSGCLVSSGQKVTCSWV